MNRHFVQLGFITLLILVLFTSCCHKKEEEEVIKTVSNKIWFTTKEERWNTDYYNNYIPESYRFWDYYKIPGSEENHIGIYMGVDEFGCDTWVHCAGSTGATYGSADFRYFVKILK